MQMKITEENKTARQAKLSDEIIESQKSRSELLKSKLLLVWAIGAARIGLMENAAEITWLC
jgi:hypothetical protein